MKKILWFWEMILNDQIYKFWTKLPDRSIKNIVVHHYWISIMQVAKIVRTLYNVVQWQNNFIQIWFWGPWTVISEYKWCGRQYKNVKEQ